ncbi:class I adenylate-forming enzyme family protein [Microbacterium sp. JZ31]|uniref:class I adenylate-forming enzyme family protein n=1 Tax=Microbacterium sp. JZ31 TaxID=1906274 RepID=UPI0019327268|nr:AMP-binding protein [Microbacterium sp. JZ31]
MNTAEFLVGGADPDAPFLTDDRGEHRYAELRAAAASLRGRLEELDAPPRSPVAIVAANGLFWVAAYLAVLAAGHVAVPVPVTTTPPEAAARIGWIGARVVFADARSARRLAPLLPSAATIIGEEALERGDAERAPARVDPHQDAAYVFTSGTTGHPRAVRLTHANIQANTESILGYLHLHDDDRMLVVLPFTYVFGASLLHTHLRAGASLVNQTVVAYPETVVERLERERCTGFAAVPSVLQMLARSSTMLERRLPHLRQLQLAGGRVSPPVLEQLLEAPFQADVFVMYGQTEATARLSYLPPGELRARPGSIGRGVPGVALRVVDEHGVEVAPGEIGEIRARGASISPGYLDDPEATERKMPGGELRTGDLATVDDDGFIYVVDRAEDFIKTWGHRVASQDVETVAMELPDLLAAAAVGVPCPLAGERIEILAVTRAGSELTARDVIAHCRVRLAKHMVPEAVHLVDALPLNANGKVVKSEVRALCRRLGEVAVSAKAS